MEKMDTGPVQQQNCTKHTLINSPPKYFKSLKAFNIERRFHKCHLHVTLPATGYDTIFTAMINFHGVLKQKRLLNNACPWKKNTKNQFVSAMHDYDKCIYFDLQELWFVSRKSDSRTVSLSQDLIAKWSIAHYACNYRLRHY